MRIGKLLIMAAALILTAGIAVATPLKTNNSPKTQKTSTSTKMTTHHLMGTISSINGSDLIVSHKYNGKDESSTFVLNTATKKEGALAKGDRATVYYQVSNKQNIATNVKINPTKKS